MTAKLQFGNEEHIKLAQLAKEIEGCAEVIQRSHDCNCGFCDIELEKCPSCLKESDCQFMSIPGTNMSILKCLDCGQKAAYKHVFTTLKSKLKELQTNAK